MKTVHKINYRLLLITVPLFIAEVSNAQQHFVPGYVLLNSGDTLHGYINDLEWKVNPKMIEFRKTYSGKSSSYSPLDIKSFRIKNGGWFISYTGMRDHSSWNVSQLNYNPLPDTLLDTLFLRALIVGKASLLTSFDQTQRRHFYIQKNGENITELYYKKYLRRINEGSDQVQNNEIYKGQLVKYFGDCTKVSSQLVSFPLSYSETGLRPVFQQYNQCFTSRPMYKEEKETWLFEPTFVAGINYSGLTLHYAGQKFNSSGLGYAGGFAMNCRLPRNRHAVSLYAELLLKNYKSSVPTERGPVSDFHDSIGFNFLYLKLNTFIRYQIMNQNAKPFFEIGLSNGFALKHDISIPDYSPRVYEQGIVAGIGVAIQRFQIESRIEFSNGFGFNVSSKSGFTTLYGLVGYAF